VQWRPEPGDASGYNAACSSAEVLVDPAIEQLAGLKTGPEVGIREAWTVADMRRKSRATNTIDISLLD